MPCQDARDFQILFLSAFLFLGISTRDWTLRGDLMLVALLTCLLTQLFLPQLINIVKQKNNKKNIANNFQLPIDKVLNQLSIVSWRSAIITGLGLCLLLRGNELQTMAIAGCLAIASKFLFCYRSKHFFNPANFGIIAALTLTQDAWVSPGQWGTDWWYLLLFLGTGGMILRKVGRWETSAVFLASYVALEAMRTWWLGGNWDILQHQLMSGSLLLFALFMLTDPRSIPNAGFGRLIWSMSIASLTFFLQHTFYLPTAMFWALFFLSPLTIVLDATWIAPRFSWNVSVIKESLP
jgi:Na+-transporting NADH:ubiquinone oxidoreductase subunit NqrB